MFICCCCFICIDLCGCGIGLGKEGGEVSRAVSRGRAAQVKFIQLDVIDSNAQMWNPTKSER